MNTVAIIFLMMKNVKYSMIDVLENASLFLTHERFKTDYENLLYNLQNPSIMPLFTIWLLKVFNTNHCLLNI